MTLLGLNLIATIVTMRAPGLTWGRLPIFCWGALSTSGLMVLAAPVLSGRPADGRVRPDRADLVLPGQLRAAAPTYSRTSSGSSATRRSTSSPCPGSGSSSSSCPVFARKPLWGYRLAVAGMLGVALLSFFVWQHHLFVSGINSALRPFYMLSTEVISIPTGFIFLCGMATLWRARIRYTVPMLFCLAWFFNFFIGGISGVFLSDTPSDVEHPRQLLRHGPLPLHDHGRADLHLLRRDLLLGAEDDRAALQRDAWRRSTSGRCSSPSTRLSARSSRSGCWGCRGGSSTYAVEPAAAQHLGVGVRLRARRLDAGLPGQRRLLAW